jgi:hypothetical protein
MESERLAHSYGSAITLLGGDDYLVTKRHTLDEHTVGHPLAREEWND